MATDQPETVATESIDSGEKNEAQKNNEKYPCDICKLTFTNSCILESHLAGKRHQKNVRSQNLGGLVKESTTPEGTASGTTVIGEFFCKDCGIYANSSNQLDMHMQSNKHKLKVEQKDSPDGAPIKTPKPQKKKAKTEDGKEGSPTKKSKSDGPPEVFKCTECNVETNSKTQFDQHLASNRHKNRGNPDRNGGNSNGGVSARKRKGAAFMAKKRQARLGLGYDQPLSSSFVSGGSYDQQPSNMSLLYGRAKQYSAAMMYQQQQQQAGGGFKKQNEYSYATDMGNSMNGGNKNDNEGFRNAYNRPGGMNQGGNFNNMGKKPFYGGDDNYSNYGPMGGQNMNSGQHNMPMSYNNAPMKGSFSLW